MGSDLSWKISVLVGALMFGVLLSGVFLCTDRDGNVILGNCEEYIRGPGEHYFFSKSWKQYFSIFITYPKEEN